MSIAVLFLGGCGTGQTLTHSGHRAVHVAPVAPADHAVELQLLSAAEPWLGVPYRFGGTTRDGVDCSAFVRAIYASAYDLALTRSTRTQVSEGVPVARSDLRPGDLVFFRTGRDRRHVGIYLSGDRMLHASSSKDRVLVDDFNSEYFQRTYWTARRLLDHAAPTTPTFAGGTRSEPVRPSDRPAVVTPPAQPGGGRSGW